MAGYAGIPSSSPGEGNERSNHTIVGEFLCKFGFLRIDESNLKSERYMAGRECILEVYTFPAILT